MGNFFRQVDLATNDTGRDAWGRPKVINDFSLFSQVWTHSVANRIWYMELDTGAGYSEQTAIDNSHVKSEHGHLFVTGDATTDTNLRSKRHPRYQPNRGLLYSTAVILPLPDAVGERRWGHGTHENAFFFSLIGTGAANTVNIVRRTTHGGTTTNTVIDITSAILTKFPSFDVSKGHVYDIQEEWRGVGNIYVYVDLTLVYTFELLGTLVEMSVANPALPVFYEVLNAAATMEMLVGCVDITSEGGGKANKTYTSATTGKVLMPTTNSGVAALAVKIPKTITYNGNVVQYTRDMILTELSTFCKDEAFRSVHVGRLINTTNLDALGTWVVAQDSFYEYSTNSTGVLDTAFQLDKGNLLNIYTTRNEKDFASSHTNPDPVQSDFFLTPGDIIVIEFQSDGNSTAGCTLEFAELL